MEHQLKLASSLLELDADSVLPHRYELVSHQLLPHICITPAASVRTRGLRVVKGGQSYWYHTVTNHLRSVGTGCPVLRRGRVVFNSFPVLR